MNQLETIMAELESLGTAQNRKIYARHGVGENQFGLSTAHLKALAKRLKTEHPLALDLWTTGNYDARLLATLIADPKQVTDDLLEAWVKDLDNYGITDAFTHYLVARTGFVQAKAEAWNASEQEWVAAAGWSLLGHLAAKSDLPDNYFEAWLDIIEREIHVRPNRVRYNMNHVLINIGLRNSALEAHAMEVAKRIGVVRVDHGQTGCETPDAQAYILKTKAYRHSKAKQKEGT